MRKLVLFWVVYGCFLTALVGAIVLMEKAELHLLLSRWVVKADEISVRLLDVLMKYTTEIGSSIPFVVVGVCLFWKLGYSYVLLMGQLLTTMLVQPIKHIVCAPRPKTYFEEVMPMVQLHEVDGVKMHSVMSFPSGHTAAAFVFCLGVALLAKKNWVSGVCALLAIMAGYSRIYLSQHFALDVAVGSVIGVIAALIVNKVYEYKKWNWEEMSVVTLVQSLQDRKEKKN